jgi:hypothetical protein
MSAKIFLEVSDEYLTELIFHASDGNGNGVHAGWFPAKDPHGQFICSLIANDDWENPTHVFQTRDPLEMLYWVKMAMRHANGECQSCSDDFEKIGDPTVVN